MEITQDMLGRAIIAAVKCGLLPAWTSTDEYIKNWDKIRQILEAALNS